MCEMLCGSDAYLQIEALTIVNAAETLPVYCSISSGSAQSHAVVNIPMCNKCWQMQLP